MSAMFVGGGSGPRDLAPVAARASVGAEGDRTAQQHRRDRAADPSTRYTVVAGGGGTEGGGGPSTVEALSVTEP
jgi:hypothetical protein